MTIPDLSGLITKDDVNHINMGNRQIDYTSWAKITQLIKQNAPGWEFNLRQSESSNFVWSAPNGTGFFVCYFTSPEKEATADFPYPIMDHRNNPVKFSEISSRVLTDNHRRAFCACACFTFALAHEMWSQEEVRDTALKNTVTDTQPQPQGDPVRDPSKPVVHQGFGKRLSVDEKAISIALIKAFNEKNPGKSEHLQTGFSEKFLGGKCVGDARFWTTHLLFQNQVDFMYGLLEHLQEVIDNE